jgi:hypothetical protein
MAKSLAEMVAETQAQVDGLRRAVAAKRRLLEEAHANEAGEIEQLHDTIATLREDIAKKRQYIEGWEQDYEAAMRRGDPEPPASTPRKIVTAICTFPNQAKVCVDYGDPPAEEVERLKTGFEALMG